MDLSIKFNGQKAGLLNVDIEKKTVTIIYELFMPYMIFRKKRKQQIILSSNILS